MPPPWVASIKDLSVKMTTPHASARAGISGRAPGVTAISFSPIDFFSAAARCSHLHVVAPGAVTPESLLSAALVERQP